MTRDPRRRTGWTLAELLIVIGVLGVVAAIAWPGRATDTERRLGAASDAITDALRFARSESLRTGIPHGAKITVADERVRVFWVDDGPVPPVKVFDVLHPLDRNLYDRIVPDLPFSSGADITVSSFWYAAIPPVERKAITFTGEGLPVSTHLDKSLTSGTVMVRVDGVTRTITVDALTGRIEAS